MTMKKKLLMMCLFGLFTVFNLHAGVVVDDPIEKDGDNNNKGGRTVAPFCELSVNGNILYINLSRYIGNVQIALIGSSSCTVSTSNYTISEDNSSISLNFEGYEKEEYTLIVTLQDGNTYRAVLHVE